MKNDSHKIDSHKIDSHTAKTKAYKFIKLPLLAFVKACRWYLKSLLTLGVKV
jgi:hypothetical protein